MFTISNDLYLLLPWRLSSVVLHLSTVLTYYLILPWNLPSTVLLTIPYSPYLATIAAFIYGLTLHASYHLPCYHGIFQPWSYVISILLCTMLAWHLSSIVLCHILSSRCHLKGLIDTSIMVNTIPKFNFLNPPTITPFTPPNLYA